MKKLINRAKKSKLMRIAAATGLVAMSATAAHAGTDTTFGGINTTLTGWITGSLGVLMGLGGVVISVVNLMRQQWGGVAVGFAVALLGSTGPGIITSIFTAVI